MQATQGGYAWVRVYDQTNTARSDTGVAEALTSSVYTFVPFRGIGCHLLPCCRVWEVMPILQAHYFNTTSSSHAWQS